MSLILDALKKSENDRKREADPMIADVRVATDSNKAPTWLWWLIGLLAINLLALSVVLLRPDRPTPVPSTAADTVTRSVPVPVAADRSPTIAVRPPKEQVRPLSREPEGYADSVPREIGDEDPSATTSAPVTQREPTPDDASLPLFDELRASGAVDLAPLHIDLHVYHADPARRLVYINGKKYSERDTTSEGARVERIRSDGVILSYRGSEFLLPRE